MDPRRSAWALLRFRTLSPIFRSASTVGQFNGFDFTGLTFASGDSLTGFTITSNSIGLTDADITIGPSSIFINLAGLPIDGSFTLDLTSGPSVSTPEPSSLLLLGIGLLALAGLTRKRPGSARRFAVESAH